MIQVEHVERYGVQTLEDPIGDAIRRERCLCRHCARLQPEQPSNCPSAEVLYALCKTRGMAVSVTRCADFKERA